MRNAFQVNHASDGGTYDAFVSKFSASGSSLVFSTYLGGNLADLGQGIAIDPSGNIYVTGTTNSSDFPTTSGSYQSTYGSNPAGGSFVSKFAPSGQSLTYSTYLPASQAFAIAVNATGNAYVTGFTGESGFPTTSGAFQTVEGGGFSSDAFVAELDNSGSSLVYSTYLGGNNEDYGYAIALDAAGDAFVTGTTSSPNFPLAVPIQAAGYSGVPSVFISELNNSGSSLVFSTYWGGGSAGAGSQQGNGIAADSSGNIYVAGSTTTPDFPVINAQQPVLKGAGDAFVIKLLNQPSPSVNLSSQSLSFKPEILGVPSAAQVITVTNNGAASLNISSVTATSAFSETSSCSAPIAPQASCTIQVTFTPTTVSPTTGQLTITNNATLVPVAVQLSGSGQDFLLSGSPGTSTVSPGQKAIYSVSVSPEGGLAQTIALSCSGAPQNSSCAVAPTTLALDGTDAGSATLTVTTSGSTTGMALPGSYLPRNWLNTTQSIAALSSVIILSIGALSFFLGYFSRLARTPRWALFAAFLVCLFCGCSGGGGNSGGGSGGGGGAGQSATPPGTYTISVTAAVSGGLSRTAEFTLVVN